MAKKKEYVVHLQNRIRFTTSEAVAVEDVVASLQGMDRIVRYNLPKALKALTGVKAEYAELLVVGLEDGSFIEDTVIRLFFKTPEDYHKFIEGIRKKYVSKDAEGNVVVKASAIVPVLAAISLVAVGYWLNDGKNNSAGSLVNFSGNDNTVIVIGAEAYKSSPQEFQKAIEAAVPKLRPTQTAKAGVQFLRPAIAEPGAGVEIQDGRNSVPVVVPSTIKKLPAVIEAPDHTEDSSYQDVTVNIRASDSDSEARGWAGTIEGLVDKRVRVVFSNSRDIPNALYRPSVRADVTITFADKAHTKPILIIIDKIR